MSDDPAKLLEAYRNQEPDAADRLATRALRIALRTATAMLGNREHAGDVAQDTAVEVLRGAQRVRNPDTLDAWIHRIAVRQTMRLIRRNRSRAQREVPIQDVPDALEPAGWELPHDAAERRELAEALRGAIDLLPERQRIALVLRYVHDLSHEQIAEAMGVRPGTAGALISRGRAALRTTQALEQFAEDERGGAS
jgi:RNA polymerase sigma-70 factor (ECF subfamily)